MLIGEFSRRCGVSIRMLRYYENRNLLLPGRTKSGYRVYDDGDLEVVKQIAVLNAAGLRLKAIRHILPCARPHSLGFRPCAKFKASVRQRLAELDNQIVVLSESRHHLADYLDVSD